MKKVFSMLLCLVAATNAQYFSEGWKPGQAVPTTRTPSASQAAYTPAASSSPKSTKEMLQSLLDVNNILRSGPVQQIFQRVGVNITESLAKAQAEQDKLWDSRIPLITDNNYADVIVNETLTEQEEKDRVWFLVITVSSARQEGISKFVDTVFDKAYSTALEKDDLPDVRWGRIDYLNVTGITTKWSVWQAPYLVVLKDRGQTLRFYKTSQIRLTDDLIYEFLKEKGYENTPPWKTAYAPGGSREYLLDYLALVLTKVYDVFVLLPKWAVYILTGTIGSFAIGILHGKPKPKPATPGTRASAKPQVEAAAPVSASVPPSTATSTSASQTPGSPTAKRGSKGRKSGKK